MPQYPYYIAPWLEQLAQNPPEEERRKLRMLIAVNIGDQNTLRDLLGADSESLSDFYPDLTTPNPSTEDTIQSFLEKYDPHYSSAKMAINPASNETLQGIPMAPAIDYAAALEKDASPISEETEDEQAKLINGFLSAVPASKKRVAHSKSPAEKPSTSVKEPKEPETPTLTESLARIMIKNGNYAKAIEIITELNLKNPEKSVYFADQIRFLRKLIINEQKK